MTCQEMSIIAMFEEGSMTPSEIAAEIGGLDELAVKAFLLQRSGMYRDIALQQSKGITTNANGESQPLPPALANASALDFSLDITDSEYKEFLLLYKNIARDCDVDAATRVRVLKDLLDEKRGRNKIQVQNAPQFNINVLNIELQRVKAAKERTKLIGMSSRSVVEKNSLNHSTDGSPTQEFSSASTNDNSCSSFSSNLSRTRKILEAEVVK